MGGECEEERQEVEEQQEEVENSQGEDLERRSSKPESSLMVVEP